MRNLTADKLDKHNKKSSFVCASVGSFPYLAYYSGHDDLIIFTKRRLREHFIEFCNIIGLEVSAHIYVLRDAKFSLLLHRKFLRVPIARQTFFFEDHSDYVLIRYQEWLSQRSVYCILIDRYCLDISLFNVIHYPSLAHRLKIYFRGIDISRITLLKNSLLRNKLCRVEPMINFYSWEAIFRPSLTCYEILKKIIAIKDIKPQLGIPSSCSVLFLDSPYPRFSDKKVLSILNNHAKTTIVKPHPNEQLSPVAMSLIENGATLAKNRLVPSELFCFSGVRLVITTDESTSLESFLESSVPCISLKRLWMEHNGNFLPKYRLVNYPENVIELRRLVKQCADFS